MIFEHNGIPYSIDRRGYIRDVEYVDSRKGPETGAGRLELINRLIKAQKIDQSGGLKKYPGKNFVWFFHI